MGKIAGGVIGAGVGFAASFPVARRTRALRGADFPKQQHLESTRAERQKHQLILDFLDFKDNVKNSQPRPRENEFKDFLKNQLDLSEREFQAAVECFKDQFGRSTVEKEIRQTIQTKITSYDESIKILEAEKQQHLEKLDLTTGDWSISIVLSGLLGLFGWFIGAKIDTNREVSEEKRAEEAMIDSRK